MSTKVLQYAHQSLAASGFAVIAASVAATLRPDLWTSGMECVADFSSVDAKNKLGYIVGVQRLTARLAGIDRPVLVLTRSTDQLAQRMEWVTGFKVEQIEAEAKATTAATGRETATARRINPLPSAQGIQTEEAPRPCTECANLINEVCLAVVRGEVPTQPATRNQPRLCLAYAPNYYLTSGDHRDYRTGKELWPELLAKKDYPVLESPTPEEIAHEHTGALDKATALLADMLKDGSRSTAEIFENAEAASLSERTMQRAADMLGVVKGKVGFNGGWVWALHDDHQ